VSVRHFVATALPDLLFNIHTKIKCVKIILISVKGKVKIAKLILLRVQQKISIKRCYFQFKKDRPDLRDLATMTYSENITLN
jgi:hypothetical protein